MSSESLNVCFKYIFNRSTEDGSSRLGSLCSVLRAAYCSRVHGKPYKAGCSWELSLVYRGAPGLQLDQEDSYQQRDAQYTTNNWECSHRRFNAEATGWCCQQAASMRTYRRMCLDLVELNAADAELSVEVMMHICVLRVAAQSRPQTGVVCLRWWTLVAIAPVWAC